MKFTKKHLYALYAVAILFGFIILGYGITKFDNYQTELDITINNFSEAIDSLLLSQITLEGPHIYKKENLTWGKSQHIWHVTSKVTSKEYPQYYYGFYIIKTVNDDNSIEWYCLAQYHPIDKKVTLNNTINFGYHNVSIQQKYLLLYPNFYMRPHLKERQDAIKLLQRIQQQTSQ